MAHGGHGRRPRGGAEPPPREGRPGRSGKGLGQSGRGAAGRARRRPPSLASPTASLELRPAPHLLTAAVRGRRPPASLTSAAAGPGSRGGGRRVRQQSITPSKPELGSGGERAEASERLEFGASGVFAPGTPVAAEAVADRSAGADGRRRRARPYGSRTPVSPPASTSRRPPRPSSSQVLGRRPPGGPEPARAATGRGVEPDVLPTTGVRLADRTRTFTPPAPGDLSTPSKSRRHASPKTTKLYDRTADTVTVDEIERIVI